MISDISQNSAIQHNSLVMIIPSIVKKGVEWEIWPQLWNCMNVKKKTKHDWILSLKTITIKKYTEPIFYLAYVLD